jgi:hypothetical protein
MLLTHEVRNRSLKFRQHERQIVVGCDHSQRPRSLRTIMGMSSFPTKGVLGADFDRSLLAVVGCRLQDLSSPQTLSKEYRSVAEPTNEDWGKIHAKAWLHPEFRRMLETDPTKAIKAYGAEVGKTFDKIVTVRPKPKGIPDDFLADVNPFPPSCC